LFRSDYRPASGPTRPPGDSRRGKGGIGANPNRLCHLVQACCVNTPAGACIRGVSYHTTLRATLKCTIVSNARRAGWRRKRTLNPPTRRPDNRYRYETTTARRERRGDVLWFPPPKGRVGEKPDHAVEVTKGFWLRAEML